MLVYIIKLIKASFDLIIDFFNIKIDDIKDFFQH